MPDALTSGRAASARRSDGEAHRSSAGRGMLALMAVLFFLQSWSPVGLLRTGSLYLLDRGMNVQQIGVIEGASITCVL